LRGPSRDTVIRVTDARPDLNKDHSSGQTQEAERRNSKKKKLFPLFHNQGISVYN
jgi:hypothetical protein